MKAQIKTTVMSILISGAAITIPALIVHATQDQKTEGRLSDQIESRFEHDATLQNRGLKAEVEASVATLTGTVETSVQKEQAGRLALVAGVSSVKNQIVVDPTPKGIAQKTEDKVKSGVDKSVDATEKGLEKTGEALSKAGAEVTDAWILSAVKTSFTGENLLKGSDINVDCDQHVVTLRGTVTTEAGRSRAVELARKTKGVHRVVDKLTIGQKS